MEREKPHTRAENCENFPGKIMVDIQNVRKWHVYIYIYIYIYIKQNKVDPPKGLETE